MLTWHALLFNALALIMQDSGAFWSQALWLNGAPDWVAGELAALEGGAPNDAIDDNPPF